MLKKVRAHCKSKLGPHALPDVSYCKEMLLLLHTCLVRIMPQQSQTHAGELDASVLDYSTVLQIEADHVEATFHRGTVFEKLGKLDEAIADFSKVLSLEPDHVKASYARGTCRNLKGDFAPAIGAFCCANAC